MTENKSNILDGKSIADQILLEIQTSLSQIKTETGKVPGLAVVLVGERKDSQTSVKMKKQAAEKVGIYFVLKEFPENISQEDLLRSVIDLNNDPTIHGLIVQLPLPKHIKELEILDAVSYEKDIDGFHPLNIGALTMKGRDPLFVPCTPKGCIELLDRSGISLEGKHVVVLGRSNTVGIPAAMLSLHRNATITVCHSKTNNVEDLVRQADILIAAVGRPQMVKKDWVKKGVVVIDVGINSITDSTKKAGYRLVGDVDFEGVKEVASYITPVPGGVGPMTVAMLLQNTITGFKRQMEKKK